jgi:hypothetical protein
MQRANRTDHIRLTSHPDPGAKQPFPISWGAEGARARGPIIATVSRPQDRNAIGSHGGSYAVYRALAVSAGALDPIRRPDLTNTHPAANIGPFSQWQDARTIVSLDPWGHLVGQSFAQEIAEGLDLRPTIAVTKARLDLHEISRELAAGRLRSDGKVVHEKGGISVVKIAIDPVWYLPGIAERFGCPEMSLRRALFEQTAGMYPELVTRLDLQVFLPPIGGTTVYLMGDVERLGKCARSAQAGGLGIIVYNRKEGRALGEVTKFLVYNARKRQEGGDAAATYFERTECVAGVQDARFQELMPDVIHWLGVARIDRFVSMSDMKYDALSRQGIEIVERIPIPEALVPADAHVEIAAKKAAGYYAPEAVRADEAIRPPGRPLDKY